MIKARYLVPGTAVFLDGFNQPRTALRVHRHDDTVIVAYDALAGEITYGVEEGVTVVGELDPDEAADHREAARTGGTFTGKYLSGAADPQRTQLTRVLADHLDYIADQLRAASLRLPGPVAVYVHLFAKSDNREDALATVDKLAEVIGATPRWDDRDGEYGNYEAEVREGRAWTLHAHAFEKRPVSTEDQLRAEIAELKAQLAGGAR